MRKQIPAGLPRTLKDLNAAVGKASRTVFDLGHDATPEAFDAAADELYRAFAIARDLARPNDVTGCPAHPQGAVDPNPESGWGECLVCNTRRRRTRSHVHSVQAGAAKVRKAGHIPVPQSWAAPSPEYVKAAARLSYMADLGGASLEAARAQLGPDARYEDLVLHAAAHPVTPPGNGTARNETERPGATVPACECGTALDPDGTCWNCTTTPEGATP